MSYKGFAREETLITADALKARLDEDDPNLVVIAVANPVDYHLGHLPGALRVWRSDYEFEMGAKYPYTGKILRGEPFISFLQELGLQENSEIILYDHGIEATRLWWALRLHGISSKVLDGGIRAWKAAGHKTVLSRVPTPEPGKIQGNFSAKNLYADMKRVKSAQDSGTYQVWDVRSPEEWNGEILMRGASRKGRIPWSQRIDWQDFKDPETGEFLDAKRMQAVVDRAGFDPQKKQIFYCQAAVRSSQPVFALYLLGWSEENIMNYDGSWIEWSYYGENPVFFENAA